ncbi:hypothetical protein [Achromobacter spanius]|uniref:Uncharacterized protein n=1 Tax=Achromobacter spanius TaxID=217203 RepID=A0AAW3I1X6_9BURK|nr:hypothetical protein [Achromobacter spanius]KNE25832.1 hypothetical protein AFM18_20635 [Achromobacter spanius]
MFLILYIAFGIVTYVLSWILATAGMLRLLEIHSVFDRLLPDTNWWFLLLLAGSLYVFWDAAQNFVTVVLKRLIWSPDDGKI